MKISHQREKCLGCGACAAICPEFWSMSEDGKAKLKNSQTNGKTGNDELEIVKSECNQSAAEACPAQIIKIETNCK